MTIQQEKVVIIIIINNTRKSNEEQSCEVTVTKGFSHVCNIIGPPISQWASHNRESKSRLIIDMMKIDLDCRQLKSICIHTTYPGLNNFTLVSTFIYKHLFWVHSYDNSSCTRTNTSSLKNAAPELTHGKWSN